MRRHHRPLPNNKKAFPLPTEDLFCLLNSDRICDLVHEATRSVCYAAPGILNLIAVAMAGVAKRIGPEMITVCVDFDKKTMRMGYGELSAIKSLRDAGITIHHASGLRSGLLIVDDAGFSFTPTPLYLESEPTNVNTRNALRLSSAQVAEALARISPGAKAIAIAQAINEEDKVRIAAIPLEVGSVQVSSDKLNRVEQALQLLPPVKFDVARQVRVFEPYFQYVDMHLEGASIQRHRIAIPPSIQNLGGGTELEGRLRTTFDLIERDGRFSSKALEKALNDIRTHLTPSLGKDHGRVVLKAVKPHLEKRIAEFRLALAAHRKSVAADLQKYLDESRKQIVEYFQDKVMSSPPDALLGGLLDGKPTADDARRWLNSELDRVFPTAGSLIQDMRLDVRFKDVTFETLNQPDFLGSVKKAFPNIDWDKAYEEFRAMGPANEQ